MSTFRVSPQAQGQWLNLGSLAGDGINVFIKFDRDRGMIVRRVIPERVMTQAATENKYRREEIFKKGALLRGTQKHWLPVCSIPTAIDLQWRDELGDPKKDPDAWKKWKARLNSSEYRNFRTSEHHL